MRSLKCKALLLSTKIDPTEPGKFFYRQNRWKKFDGEQLESLEKVAERRFLRMQDLKEKFYFRSQPKLSLPPA